MDLVNAAERGDINAVNLLLSKRRDVNFQGGGKETAFHRASAGGHTEVCRILARSGAIANLPDRYGNTAAHHAAMGGQAETLKFLVTHGCDINARCGSGFTPLHFAAQRGHVDTITALIMLGANPAVKNREGKTPLEVASKEEARAAIRATFRRASVRMDSPPVGTAPLPPASGVTSPPLPPSHVSPVPYMGDGSPPEINSLPAQPVELPPRYSYSPGVLSPSMPGEMRSMRANISSLSLGGGVPVDTTPHAYPLRGQLNNPYGFSPDPSTPVQYPSMQLAGGASGVGSPMVVTPSPQRSLSMRVNSGHDLFGQIEPTAVTGIRDVYGASREGTATPPAGKPSLVGARSSNVSLWGPEVNSPPILTSPTGGKNARTSEDGAPRRVVPPLPTAAAAAAAVTTPEDSAAPKAVSKTTTSKMAPKQFTFLVDVPRVSRRPFRCEATVATADDVREEVEKRIPRAHGMQISYFDDDFKEYCLLDDDSMPYLPLRAKLLLEDGSVLRTPRPPQ